MSRRRRAVALAGLSLLLGGLAASDIRGREAALRSRIGPTVRVLVARTAIPVRGRLTPDRLAMREVPARWAPAGAFGRAADVAGLRAAVAIPAGADLMVGVVDDGRGGAAVPVRRGERVADVVAVGTAELVTTGTHVDVLVTRDGEDGRGVARLALEDVEVLAARPAPEARSEDGSARVAASLRVTVRQAVYLAAAQSFAREIRLLPRAAGDARRGDAGLSVGSGL